MNTMNNEDNIALIAKAVELANENNNKVTGLSLIHI